jgi:HEAT repeat protein
VGEGSAEPQAAALAAIKELGAEKNILKEFLLPNLAAQPRAATARAIGLLGQSSPEALAALYDVTNTATNDIVRVEAACALHELGASREWLLAQLEKTLSEGSNAGKVRAMDALAELGNKAESATPALRELLADSDDAVSDGALEALVAISVRGSK